MLEAKQINAADVNLTNLGTVISIFVVFQIAGLNCYDRSCKFMSMGLLPHFTIFQLRNFSHKKVWCGSGA